MGCFNSSEAAPEANNDAVVNDNVNEEKADETAKEENKEEVKKEEKKPEEKEEAPVENDNDNNADEDDVGGDIFDKYDFKEELGRGAFSIVKLAVNRKNNNKVAVKVIDKTKMSDQYKKNLQMETDILRKVCHPNVITMLEIFETEEYLFLVMELVTGGELFDKIVEKGCYTEKEAAVLVKKITLAIDYLHGLDICHRDLKPENLLLASEIEDTEVKIADFGLSKIINQEVMMQTACGTPGYVAPEVLSATGYDREVDMWSIGVITYILLCGFPPFFGETVPELFEQIMGAEYDYPPDYWDEVSDTAKDFINKLLVVDPEKRMTTTQALAHPWLTELQADTQLNVGAKMGKYVDEHKKEVLPSITKDTVDF